MSASRRLIPTFMLLCLVAHVSFGSHGWMVLAAPTQDGNSDALRYRISEVFVGSLRQEVSISNPTAHKIMGGRLYIPLVKNETAFHCVKLQNISSTIGQPTITRDDSNNTYAYWHNIVLDRDVEITIELAYDVLSFTTAFLIDASRVLPYDNGSDLYTRYTRPEELMQANDPAIYLAVQDVVGNASNAHEKAARIYDFVVKHVHYSAQDYERGALWALENSTGDCSEFSYLFVALCRAAGIPAIVKTGFALQSVGVATDSGHMWAEYYLEGYGWIPVDATWKLFDSLDFRHFNSLQSFSGLIVYSNAFFNYTSGPGLLDVEQTQSVSLTKNTPNTFVDFPSRNITGIITRLNQARLLLSVARALFMQTIAPSTVEALQLNLGQSEARLQEVATVCQTDLKATRSLAAEAAQSADDAMGEAMKLLTLTIITYVALLISTTLIALVLLERHRRKRK